MKHMEYIIILVLYILIKLSQEIKIQTEQHYEVIKMYIFTYHKLNTDVIIKLLQLIYSILDINHKIV